MNARVLTLTAMGCLILVGCGTYIKPGTVSEKVDLSGSVTSEGKPVADVYLFLQPVDGGQPAQFKLDKDGGFKGKVVPGKYTYHFPEEDEDMELPEVKRLQESIKQVPTRYRTPNLNRTVEVASGADMKIDLN